MKNANQSVLFIDLLFKVSRKLRNLLDARIREHGLTLARALTLSALKDQDDFFQKNLAEELGIEHATLVRLIDALEEQGLVVRNVAEDDRRAKRVTLTPEGRETVEEIEAYASELSRDVMSGIKETGIVGAMGVLQHIADAVEKEGHA
ncbi:MULTISPECIES: MarR family winged helix-turn-helix transcriptional regulator [Bartonella]|uniref:Transcriptional regulator, MarR family n=1 Tax=Bartonella choladocola TaxID=2750995 RepID=A0A1U9ML51_9HYPH|nr:MULTISPECIES: MarR family transcriptional regulator [Bartonella]AQT48381.1 transcriptional regulator, MarR family [Bartonella choladocola]MBH9975001.1 MarR family transcriptional regulator [Bartonella choladocola]MBI0014607.1 MarR family transcriptional regulator [Bartonella sp. B10834G3]MBI0139367.1 MarR family transcriptional regulator [Bartonella choladocola]